MIRSTALAAMTCLAVLLTGCATVYRGPADYVDYSLEGKAKASTTAALVGTNPKVQNTYEDEYIYDAAGNLVKHKQTEYFKYDSSQPSFVVWETDFKVVGGVTLPYRQSANDVVYVEIDYDLLASQSKGAVKQGTLDRHFSVQQQAGFDKVYTTWTPELSQFPVDFRADDKFVISQRKFSYYGGFSTENILTLGYDNIVLKHYLYSHAKLVEGVNKSFQWNLFQMNSNQSYRPKDSEFNYEWKVIANTIVQTKTTFTETQGTSKMTFEEVAEYNDAGQRGGEVWTSQIDKGKPVTLFKQTLTY